MVEDALPGMLAARAIGMDSIVISERHNDMPRAELDAVALRRFESHGEILAALEGEIQKGRG